MSKPLKRSAMDMLAAAGVVELVAAPPAPPAQPAAVAAVSAQPKRRNVTKAKTKQLTLYLDDPVYRQLREIAFNEDTKMHPLILEGLDMLFKSRNRPQLARPAPKG
jgi:hypothetical protein